MPGDTNTNLGANTNRNAELTSTLVTSTTYTCNACQISFQNGQQQRTHMKEPWHVNNVKRRVDSLPPIPADGFETPVSKKAEGDPLAVRSRRTKLPVSSDDEATEEAEEQSVSPFQCLFCNDGFPSDEAGFVMNLEHMDRVHGMSIPDSDMVEDPLSLVGYLATEVRIWHECLYCGATKPSTSGIQSHMRDKGHCRLNLDREPELLDFWEVLDSDDEEEDDSAALEQEPPIHLSETEMRFASGKVIGSRHAAPTPKKTFRRRDLATPALPQGLEEEASSSLTVAPHLSSSRQLAQREEMGLIGVPLQQRQALLSAEKKAQRSEAMARRAREWVYAKGANFQTYDQVDTKMKMGKQNHKLQPR